MLLGTSVIIIIMVIDVWMWWAYGKFLCLTIAIFPPSFFLHLPFSFLYRPWNGFWSSCLYTLLFSYLIRSGEEDRLSSRKLKPLNHFAETFYGELIVFVLVYLPIRIGNILITLINQILLLTNQGKYFIYDI